MIEKMKVFHIVSTAKNKKAMLDKIRDLGIMHFAIKENPDRECIEKFDTLSKTSQILKDYSSKDVSKEILSDEAFEKMYTNVLNALENKRIALSIKSEASLEADRIRAWGDFSIEELEKLNKKDFDFHFYTMGKKEFDDIKNSKDIKFIKLSSIDKMETVACIGKLPSTISAMEFVLPEISLGMLESQIKESEKTIFECDEILKDASKYELSFNDQMLKAQNASEYSSMNNTVSTEDSLIWLSGYVPECDIASFKELAAKESWAYAIDDPSEDDEKVPTKVKYTKLTRLMIPIFDILGTVPGYHEYDISFWFLGFFTLFFAMIIGDAGYGAIFLIGAILATVKFKKVNNAILLLYVLSIATIIWGSLTGTWLGLEAAMKVPFLKALVIPSFANYPEYFGVSTTDQQNAIMKFCFIIGTIQLTLACIMNIKKKLKSKDLSLIADIGWLLAIDALYFVVLFLVIGEKINLIPVAMIVGVGFLLVILFGGMSKDKTFIQGLKAGVGDAFTTFLNTISAFGNIMSYIRLFAVGMASLAIAQSFNDMAAGFSGPLVIIGAVIMIIGHVLNIIMGFLSVVVHGVRLNLLEFSGQLGMEWSGIEYAPFKKLDKIKK